MSCTQFFNNLMRQFVVFFLLIATQTSCKTILLNRAMKDPVVETSLSIKEFQVKHNYSTENSLILRGDTATALERLFLGLSVGYYIFDNKGRQICYNGMAKCQGSQFRQLLANHIDSFELCENSEVTLEQVVKQTYDLNENAVSIADFATCDYYVVVYWQKFLGGAKGYDEEVKWMEDEIKVSGVGLKFTFIKVNADLQDTWGFIPGKKAKLKLEKKGGNLAIEIDDLPLKK